VIDEIGRVDHGTTQTDSLELERQRGITIKSAVVSFVIDDVTVNLIDTPGHPDFIAEVERVLHVLDGVVLVVSAVEGVQAQTRILLRTLRRLRVPTLIFVNKIDRVGARGEGVVAEIAGKLTPSVVAMGAVHNLGTKAAGYAPFDGDTSFTGAVADMLARRDEEILAASVAGDVADDRLRHALVAQTGQALVHPVFFGSAITGVGVGALLDGIVSLLPAAAGDADGQLSGSVFKIERGPRGEKVAYLRVFAGRLQTRERVPVRGSEDRVTEIRVFERGDTVLRSSVGPGRIAKVWGLGAIRIGDVIGETRRPVEHPFDPPTLETVVTPGRPSEKGALHAALTQLAEQDPLIDLRQDDLRQELSVSLYGEVQKEVIEATLADDYGLQVGFRETTVICVERPARAGEAVERIGNGNPFLATVGLRIEPMAIGSGVSLELDVPLGSVPLYVYGSVDAFRAAMESIVTETLREGLHAWQVTDCAITMTHAGYDAPGTGPRDFRYLTPLVLMQALRDAGTVVCEPFHRFHLDIPSDTFGAVGQALARLGAAPEEVVVTGTSSQLTGRIAAAKVSELQRRLPGLTRGEGVMLATSSHEHRPVRGKPPSRPRMGLDPGNREEYLRHVLRGF
jgi:ribosomal protection tetracycline resistance protein